MTSNSGTAKFLFCGLWISENAKTLESAGLCVASDFSVYIRKVSAKSTWLLLLLPFLLLLCDACHSQKGCKGVRYYTTQHSGNSGSVAKPHSMAVSRSAGVRKKGSGTLSFSNRSSSHKSGSGTLTLTTPSAKKKKPGNMGFYKPKPQKNGSVSMTFSKKKVKAKPLPPWTKKAQRMDKRKAKSGITKGGKKPSKHSMEH